MIIPTVLMFICYVLFKIADPAMPYLAFAAIVGMAAAGLWLEYVGEGSK